MDPVALAREFGIPLAGLALFAVAIARGWLRSGTEVDRAASALALVMTDALLTAQKEVAYREALRVEERGRSERLEQALATQTSTLRDMVEVLKDVEREMTRIEPRGPR